MDNYRKVAEILDFLDVDNFFKMGKTGTGMCINKKRTSIYFSVNSCWIRGKTKKYTDALVEGIISQEAVRRYVLHLRLP